MTLEELKTVIVRRIKTLDLYSLEVREIISIRTKKQMADFIKSHFVTLCHNRIITPDMIDKCAFLKKEGITANEDADTGYSLLTEGFHNIGGDATAVLLGFAQCDAIGKAQIKAYDKSRVSAFDDVDVSATDESSVTLGMNSTVRLFCNARAYAMGNGTVFAHGQSEVIALGKASVEANHNATVKTRSNCEGIPTVMLRENAFCDAIGQVKLAGIEHKAVLRTIYDDEIYISDQSGVNRIKKTRNAMQIHLLGAEEQLLPF